MTNLVKGATIDTTHLILDQRLQNGPLLEAGTPPQGLRPQNLKKCCHDSSFYRKLPKMLSALDHLLVTMS